MLATNSVYHARVFSVYVGQTLFIGGLARIDHLESDGNFTRYQEVQIIRSLFAGFRTVLYEFRFGILSDF